MASETRIRHALLRKVQGAAFGTEAFLDAMGLNNSAWRQRRSSDETAIAFGLEKPAYHGTMGPLDCAMCGIVNMATFHAKVSMKEVARLVREQWEPLTKAIARAERGYFIEPGVVRVPELPRDQQQFLAIGVITDNKTFEKHIEFGIGELQAAINQVNRAGAAIIMLDLQRVVRMAYEMAREADIDFPARLCPDPDDAKAWREWLDAIDEYLVRAGVRARARLKKKVTA